MSSQSKHQYRRLDDPAQIRLVSIVHRQNRKRIHLKLELVSINEVAGQYEAVSYQWGPPSTGRHVVIDGKTLMLRENIWHCLKHLREHALTNSRLWIDSICINQNDEQEKSQQVAKMAQIFQNASRVLIWLGSTSLQTYLLKPGLDSLEDSITDLPTKNWDAWIDVLGYSDPRSRSLENQIMSIVYNQYWERVWIVQETELAEDACIVYGKALLSRECLPAMYWAARENSKPGYQSWISRQRDPNMISSTGILDHHPILGIGGHKRNMQESPSTYSLANLIRYFHHKRCTDSRDYVFGLVGLLNPDRPFEIDYAFSSEEIAVRALQYLEEEGTQNPIGSLGLDLSAACALLEALGVTSFSYAKYEEELPGERAEAMGLKRLHLFFKPLEILIPHDDDVQPEVTPYEDVVQLNVSGTLQKNLYVMKKDMPFQVMLLNGRIRHFAHTQDLKQRGKKPCVLLCSLGTSYFIIVRRDPSDSTTTTIEHFIRHDMTRQFHESPLSLEVQLPLNVRDVLEREINACQINWNNQKPKPSSKSLLELPMHEFISICELLA